MNRRAVPASPFPREPALNLTRDEKITCVLTFLFLGAWIWIDAFLTIMERTQ